MIAVTLSLILAQAAPSPTASPCQAETGLVKAEYPRGFDPPEEARPLSATVFVVVGSDGKVVAAKILKPSGDFSFDAASIRAAKSSTYTPKLVDCKPIEGTFLFRTSLTPGGP
jgi:TonB family protein